MKTFAALIFLAMFVVSCGGGAAGLSMDKSVGAKGSTTVFESPPTPGAN